MANSAQQVQKKPDAEVQALNVEHLHAQMLEMHAEAAQLLENARAEAAALVESARTAGDGQNAGLAALVEEIARLQAPTVNVEVPKFELPPAASDVEEGFRPVTFRSRDRSHLVVRVPRHRNTAPNGEVQTSEGRNYSFEPSGDLTVHNSDVAEFLRGRPGFNRFFVEVGKEPHSHAAMEPVLEAIQTAVIERDDAALAEIENKEAASLKRPLILNMVRKARESVQGASDEALLAEALR